MKQFVNLNLFICIISLCTVILTNNYTLKAQTDIACHVSIRCSFNIKIPNPLGGYEIKKTETYESYWERHPLNKNLHFSFDNMILPNTKSSSLKENQKLIIKTVEINVAETGTVTKTIHFGTCSENARWKKITISFFTFPSVEYFGEVQCVSNVKSRNYLIYINKDNDLYTKGKIEATYVEIANNTNFRNSHSCILPNHGKLSYKDFAGNKITESYRKKFYYRLKFKMKKIPGDGTPEKNNLYGPVRFVTFFPSLKFPNNTNVKVELPKCSYNNPIIKIPQSAKVDYAITIKKGNEYGHNYLTKDLDKKNGYFILPKKHKYTEGEHQINVEQYSGAGNTYCAHSSTFYIKKIPEFTISKPKYVFNGKDNNGKSVQIKKVNGLGTVNFSIAGSLEKDIEVYAGGLKIASRRLNNSYSKEGTTYYEGTIAIKFKAGVHKNIYVKNIECKSNKIESIELKEPDPIAFNIKTETISCHSSSIKGQKNNGKIIVSNIKGGIGKYDISINTDNCSINNNTIDGLTYKKEGYRLTIKDEKGNYTTKSVIVPQNKAIQFDIEKQTPPTMSCLKNGSITVSNPSGGAGQYKYSTAKDGHYTSSYLISGYYPGANKVFAIDKKLCVVSKSVDIPDAPPAISVKNREVTKPTCHGYNNGTYTATINNVVGNIKVESINPFINPKNISINGNTIKINKLYHGEYKIRITDNYNGDTCSISDSFSIDQKAAMKLSSIQIPVANKGTASGESTITLKTENIGTRKYYLFDYQYNKIDSIITNLNNAHFKKLKGSSENSGQIYYVNVVDNNNCSYYQDNESKYFSFHIKEPKNKLRINAKITDSIDCYGYNNGTVNLNAEGGWSEKAYIFSDDKINWSENNSFSGYSAGKQYFFVKDKNNGVDSIDVVFKQPKPLKSYLDSSLNVLCYNTNSGWARFKVTGGTYPYKFNEDINTITKLNEKDTLLTARKLYDGKYQFTIVDKNSCTIKTKTIAINEPSELKIPYKKIIHTSCELDNGQIHSCAKGGTEPYKYLWENSNKQTILEHKDYNTNDTSKLENIAADSYNLIVSDKNGCATKIENITIKPYTNPTFAEFKSVNAKCHNDKNGEIHVKAKKGTNQIDKFYNEALNHNYKKTNTTGIFKNLPVDNYSIYVYDNIGCKSNSPLDVTIKQPDPLMSVVKKIVPVKEKNSKSGQIHFFIKGGNSGLKTIQLIDSKQKQTAIMHERNLFDIYFDKLYADDYKIVTTDTKGCKNTSDVQSVKQPNIALGFNVVNKKDAKCKASTGEFTIEAFGGWGQYQYKLASDKRYYPSNKFKNKNAGNYIVSVIDAKGAEFSNTVTIHEPKDSLQADLFDVSNPTCQNNGSISLKLKGGTPPYKLFFHGEKDTTVISKAQKHTINNRPVGGYTLCIKDENECIFNQETMLSDKDMMQITKFDFTYPKNNKSKDGAINAIVTGGKAPFKYSWEKIPGDIINQNKAKIENVAAGNYKLSVSEKNNCAVSKTTYLSAINGTPLQIVKITNEKSYLANDGEAQLKTSLENITKIEIVDPEGKINSFTNDKKAVNIKIDGKNIYLSKLKGGDYWVSAINNNQKQYSKFYIKPYNKFEFCDIKVTNARRRNENSGAIQVALNGGAGNNTFKWLTPKKANPVIENNENTSAIKNTIAGVYKLTVTDKYNNIITKTINIKQPKEDLDISINKFQNQSCKGYQDAWVELKAKGGWEQYQYRQDKVKYFSNENLWKNLKVGKHRFYITDKMGVIDSVDIDITEPKFLKAKVNFIDNLDCKNDTDGKILFDISGGTKPYRFRFKQQDMWIEDTCAKNLKAGHYTYIFTDKNNCIGQDTIKAYMPEPDSLLFKNIAITHTTCNTDNGRIKVKMKGGTKPYLYKWTDLHGNDIGTKPTVGSLKQNTQYILKVVDAHNCKQEFKQLIKPSTKPLIDSIKTIPVLCHGEASGKAQIIDITPAVPFAPYSIHWQNNDIGKISEGYKVGTYKVTIKDQNNCFTQKQFDITEPDTLKVDIKEYKDAHCFGYNDGFIEVEAYGGVGKYKYIWENGQTSSKIEKLIKGKYQLKVIDSNECFIQRTFEIKQPEKLIVDLGEDIEICPGNSITIDGQDFASHKWYNKSKTITKQRFIKVNKDGKYYLEVTNDIGCYAHDTIQVLVGNNALKADFLMASEADMGDTICIYELSNMELDSMKWNYKQEVFTDITQEKLPEYILHLKGEQKGVYNVMLKAYSGGCISTSVKQIEIIDSVENNQNPDDLGYKDPLILEVKIFPNPTNGNFTAKIKLREIADIKLNLFSINFGSIIDKKEQKGMKTYQVDYQLGNLNTGTYVLMVIAQKERKQVKIIIK